MQLIQTLKRAVSDDSRGVSPVIGVILMVAITVILAAVIATFVLGLGEQVSETAPQANFDFDLETGSPDALTITHDGGQTIERDTIAIDIGGSRAYEDGASTSDFAINGNDDFPTEIAAGSSLSLDDGPTDISGDQEIRVLYLPDEGSTATLASTELEFN